jgi:hypothetical protein
MNMLRKSFAVCLLALLVAASVVPTASAAVSSWLSTVGTVGGGFTPGDAAATVDNGTDGSLYLWLRNDAKLQSVAYNLAAATPGIIEFTGVTVFTPDLVIPPATVIGSRWNTPVGPGAISGDKLTITNFSAVNVDKSGLDTATRNFDQLWDPAANAALFAKIDYHSIGVGTTALALTEGSTLIVEGSVQPPLTFGTGSITVTGEPPTTVVGDLNLVADTLNETVTGQVALTGVATLAFDAINAPVFTPLIAGKTLELPTLPTLDNAGNFSWNTAGAKRGTYAWAITGTGAGGVGTDGGTISVEVQQIPEPATFAMVGLALVGCVGAARRRG